jgi:hypothetical protein
VDVEREQQACSRVPQIVETDIWQTGLSQNSFEIVEEVGGIDRSTDPRREDKAGISPAGTSDEAFLALACTMESQRLGDEVENRELPLFYRHAYARARLSSDSQFDSHGDGLTATMRTQADREPCYLKRV